MCADESGIHDGAKFCTLSGYIGAAESWICFEREWEKILERFDVLDFHSKDFFAFGPDGCRAGKYRKFSDQSARRSYGDWSDERANLFLRQLLETIHLSRLRPLGATVDRAAFFALTYGERRFLTGGHFDGNKWLTNGAPTKPYFLLFDHCLVEAAQLTAADEKILYLFDRQKLYESRAIEQFGESARTAEEEIRSKFGGVSYHKRHDVPGLQAADLYTHCWNRYLTDKKRVGDIRTEALEILTLKQRGMKQYTAKHMRMMLSRIPPKVLSSMRKAIDPGKTERGDG